MRTMLLASLVLAAVGCGGATEITSTKVGASSAQNAAGSPGAHAERAFFYQIDQNGDVLTFEVPAYLAGAIAAAYGRPELVDPLRAQIAAANEQLGSLDLSNASFERADAVVDAMNLALAGRLGVDPRTLVLSTPVPYALDR